MQAFQIDHGGPPNRSGRPRSCVKCLDEMRAKQDDMNRNPSSYAVEALRLAIRSAGTVKLFRPEHRVAALAGVNYGRNVHGSLVNFDHWIWMPGALQRIAGLARTKRRSYISNQT